MLDDVFGIERDPGYKDTVALSAAGWRDRQARSRSISSRGCGPTSGKPYARLLDNQNGTESVPLVIVNSFGKGKAVYLGFTGLYNQMPPVKPQLTACTGRFSRISWPAHGRYRVAAEGGADAGPDVAAYLWRRRVFWVLSGPAVSAASGKDGGRRRGSRCQGRDKKREFTLPAARHVYDVLEGQYLGETDRFPISR